MLDLLSKKKFVFYISNRGRCHDERHKVAWNRGEYLSAPSASPCYHYFSQSFDDELSRITSPPCIHPLFPAIGCQHKLAECCKMSPVLLIAPIEGWRLPKSFKNWRDRSTAVRSDSSALRERFLFLVLEVEDSIVHSKHCVFSVVCLENFRVK